MTERSEKSAGNGALFSATAIGMAGDLEELRRCVVQHLDSLEALALQCARGGDNASERLEQEVNRSRELTEQLEADRQMLAAAWERLECERLEVAGHRAVGNAQPSPPRARLVEQVPAVERPAHHEVNNPAAANPVAESILRQFQALCSDVRRTSNARVTSR